MSRTEGLDVVVNIADIKSEKKLPNGWIDKKVSEFTVEHKQGYYTKESYTGFGTYLIRITDLNNPNINYSKMPKLVVEEKEFNQFKVEVGDFLFARSGAIGRYGIVTEDFPSVFASYLIRFRFNQEAVSTRYFGYAYESDICQKQLGAITQGSSNININADNIKSLLIPYPPLPEQQKIAEILTSVDEVIEKTQAQIDKLKDLKTGMMQELLTNGIGHTEFKGSPVGRVPAEWEVMQMRDICITKQGLQIPISERYTEPAENRFVYLTIKFINTGFNPSVAEYIENPSQRVVCDESDIILARTGATGKVVTGIKGVFHNNFFKVDYDRDKIRKNYFVHYLNSPFIQTEIKKRAGTTTIPDLNHGDFYALPLLLPTLDEQIRIAKILDANDDFIGVKTRKLEALISTKKALMQDLLTGKVRVKTETTNTEVAVS